MYVLLATQHLWQVNQREQCCADDSKGSEQTEILQQGGIDEDESCERADRRDTAQQDRLYLVAQ